MLVQTDYRHENHKRFHTIYTLFGRNKNRTTKNSEIESASNSTHVRKQIGDNETKALSFHYDGDECNEKQKKKNTNSLKNFLSSKNRTLVMFWASWCPHCHAAMDSFNAASNKTETPFLMCQEGAVDTSDVIDIKFYPTIALFVNGKLKDIHKGKPDAESFLSFEKEEGLALYE